MWLGVVILLCKCLCFFIFIIVFFLFSLFCCFCVGGGFKDVNWFVFVLVNEMDMVIGGDVEGSGFRCKF